MSEKTNVKASGNTNQSAKQDYNRDEFFIVGDKLLKYKGNRESVVIPDFVSKIVEKAFEGAENLKIITIPVSVTEIGGSAFEGCYQLQQAIYKGTVKDWCGIIFGNGSANPLYYAHNLYIGGKLVEKLVIPEGAEEIGNHCFCGLNVESVVFPDSLKSLGISCFECCKSLQEIVIPANAEEIRSYAFYFCESLTSVYVPKSVKTVNQCIFYGCNGLTVYCEAPSKPEGWSDIWDLRGSEGDKNVKVTVIWGV